MKSLQDMLFNLVIIFAMLFFLSFLQINVNKQKKEGVRPPAEILIIVEWPDGYVNDVDTWLLMPNGDIVWFRDQDKNIAVLDRDDLGAANSAIRMPDGSIVKDEKNQEVVTIRSLAIGTYTLNIHMYNWHDWEPKTPVKITIMKINPMVLVLYQTTIDLTEDWQEVTVCDIDVTKWGVDIVNRGYTPLVSRRIRRGGISIDGTVRHGSAVSESGFTGGTLYIQR